MAGVGRFQKLQKSADTDDLTEDGGLMICLLTYLILRLDHFSCGNCAKINLLFLHLQEWFTVLEHYHRLSATISDLIMGNSYSFRVFAENQVGISEKSAVTKEVANIQKTGDLL